MNDADCIVVGSGASGAMAAQTLVAGGARVLMLDGGIHDDRYDGLVPPETFVEIRRTQPEQDRYLLGDAYECAAYATVGTGAQLTPPRRYITDRVAELLPMRGGDFAPLESLALGGLGSGWGLMCAVYSDDELARASLPLAAMRDAYQVAADRMGISGADDDTRPETLGHLIRVQPAPPLDATAEFLAARYRQRRAAINARNYVLGRPAMALLTQPKDDRGPTQLRDMDFYADDGAAWRPARVVATLRKNDRFAYIGGVLVTAFDDACAVTVSARDMRSGEVRHFRGSRLVLASGVLGTARIVLRSQAPMERLPLLCNDYTYLPCIVPRRVGRAMHEHAYSLTQLVLFHRRTSTDVAMGTIYSYRSLLLFRLLREMPLGARDARVLMRYLLPGFIVAGFDHPQEPTAGKQVWLETDAGSPTADRLAVAYALTDDERSDHRRREREFTGVLRTLGAWPIRRVHPPLGASIHYAGTLPFCDDERPLTLAHDGRLHGTRNVFVADASGFTFLPAKPVTLSLVANAHRVAAHALRQPA